MTRIFLDGADRSAILEMKSNSLVQGFTTNPSLMKKAGVQNYAAYCKELLELVDGKPVSFEVFADEFPEMKRQALEIAHWDQDRPKAHQLYVKIPITNSKGQSSIPLIRELSHAGIKLNVTALFTTRQVRDTCEALMGGSPSIVSVFAGRIADTGRDPLPIMLASLELCRSAGDRVELLWASTREAFNIAQARSMDCPIITAPIDLIKKVPTSFDKPLEEMSLDTVRTFKKDAESAGFSL